jgi:hypothetical protein
LGANIGRVGHLTTKRSDDKSGEDWIEGQLDRHPPRADEAVLAAEGPSRAPVIKLGIAALNLGQTVISFSDCGVYARTEVESVLIAVASRTAIATSSPNQLPPATTWSSSTVLRRR